MNNRRVDKDEEYFEEEWCFKAIILNVYKIKLIPLQEIEEEIGNLVETFKDDRIATDRGRQENLVIPTKIKKKCAQKWEQEYVVNENTQWASTYSIFS